MRSRVFQNFGGGIIGLYLTLIASGPCLAQQCVGDCDGSGAVIINELILGVNIALGTADVSVCTAFDCPQHLPGIFINCAVEAVDNALLGCRTATAIPSTATPTCPLPPQQPTCRPDEGFFCVGEPCLVCVCGTLTPTPTVTYTPLATCTLSTTPTTSPTPTITATPTPTRTCASASRPATCAAGQVIACADQLCSIDCGCGTVTSTPTPTNTCTPGANPPPGCSYEGSTRTFTRTPCNHAPTETPTKTTDCSGISDLRPCVHPCGNGVCQYGFCNGECTPSRTSTPLRTPTPTLATPGNSISTATATPTQPPDPTVTLAPHACRQSNDCDAAFELCLEPGGFAGCGICYPESEIDREYQRCTTDADCGSDICEPLGLPTRTCSACSGHALVCMPGCTADDQCAPGTRCDRGRCAPQPCISDQQCPAQHSCVPAADTGAETCQRKACATDLVCGDGFCVKGLCYDALGRCTLIPA